MAKAETKVKVSDGSRRTARASSRFLRIVATERDGVITIDTVDREPGGLPTAHQSVIEPDGSTTGFEGLSDVRSELLWTVAKDITSHE